MNKQAFTFLTLFTLVLLLGVYYVTLPAESSTKEADSLIASIQESDPITQLEDEKQVLNEQMREINEQVISSSLSTSEQKLEAIEKNAMMEADLQIENNVQQLLKEAGYEQSFIEKDDDIIRVVLPQENESQSTVLQVMKLIAQMMDEDVLVEVSFE